ncbi:MAG: phosphodiester glycosidase family protein, partial [Thermoanaerobaculia bacterium]
HQAAFAINANFFDRRQRVLGAVIRSGLVVQSPRKSSWQSIFLLDEDGDPHIILPSKWSSWRKRAFMAVQAGPRLVVAGQTKKVKKGYAAARAGVCIRRNGDLLFFATPQDRKLDMDEIGRVTRRGEKDGGLACRDAMLFDGGHSTQIYASGNGHRIEVLGDPVPVFIYAKEK